MIQKERQSEYRRERGTKESKDLKVIQKKGESDYREK